MKLLKLVSIGYLLGIAPACMAAELDIIEGLTSQVWARASLENVAKVRNGEEVKRPFYDLLFGTGQTPVLTSAGVTAEAGFHWLHDPAVFCVPMGMPRIADMPSLFEFVEREDGLYIHYEFMDLWRKLELSPPPENLPHTSIGYSFAYFTEDALVVETTHIMPGIQSINGIPKSGIVNVLEEYRTEKSGNDYFLYARLRVDDPLYFEQPTDGRFGAIKSDFEMIEYECVLPDTDIDR